MVVKPLSIFTFLLFSIFLISCGGSPDSTSVAEADSTLTEYHLDEAQQKRIGLEVGSARDTLVSTSLVLTGSVTLPPNNRADISPLVSGQIRTISVTEGRFVEEGAVVAELNSPEALRLQEQHLRAWSQCQWLKAEAERQEELVKADAGALKLAQKARSDYQMALAELEGSGAQLKLMGYNLQSIRQGKFEPVLKLKAPLHGHVAMIEGRPGEFVQPGKTLLQIVNTHHLHVELDAFENQLAALRQGAELSISPTSGNFKPFKAHIFGFPGALDDNSRSVKVHAEIQDPQPKELFAGLGVRATLQSVPVQAAWVPLEAVVRQGGKLFVFVPVGKHKNKAYFRKQEVIPIVEGSNFYALRLPLPPQIVLRGAYSLEGVPQSAEEE
jgi:cobalt-zinc-cadmium efflux system membrane fusion protein